MSDLKTVNSNMANAYMTSGALINNVRNLINSTNSVNVDNALNIVNHCMGTIELINRCHSDFEKMYILNAKELHLFLYDFNIENKKINEMFKDMFKSITSIVKILVREFYLYTVVNNVIGDRTNVVKPTIDVNNSFLISSVSRIENFRLNISMYNDVLKEGKR